MYICKYLFFSFIIGLIILISIMQHDTWVHTHIETYITKTLYHDYKAHFSGTVTQFSFWNATLTLSDISVSPKQNNQWTWSAKKIKTSFSWLHFFTTGTIAVSIHIDQWNAKSAIKNKTICIKTHLQTLFENQTFPVPVKVRAISMNKAYFHCKHNENNIEASILFNSRSYVNTNSIQSTLYFLDGDIKTYDNYFLKGISGSAQVELTTTNCTLKKTTVTGGFIIPELDNEQCYIHGSWHNDYGRFSLTSSHNICSIDPVVIGKTKGRIISNFPAKLMTLCIPNIFHGKKIDGNCTVSLVFDRMNSKKIQGQIVIYNVTYNNEPWCDTIKITLGTIKNNYSGIINIRSIYGECSGNYMLHNEKQSGTIHFCNTSALRFPFMYWQIEPHQANIDISVKKQTFVIKGSCNLLHNISNQKHSCALTLHYNDEKINAKGIFDETECTYTNYAVPEDKSPNHSIEGVVKKTMHDFTWLDKNKQPCFTCKMTHAKETQHANIIGSVYFPTIQSIAHTWVGYQLQGTGKIDFSGFFNNENLSLTIEMQEGTIRLPKTYNFIDKIAAHLIFNLKNRTCNIYDTHGHLHTGSISVSKGIFSFDQSWRCSFAHIPLLIDHCVINMKKDLFAAVSGALTIIKKPIDQAACLVGTLFLDRAQVKHDIFSDTLFSNIATEKTTPLFHTPSFFCDINIKTITPITIVTPQITTDLIVQLHLSNQLLKPDISGTMSAYGGTLKFPYKPLHITRANISFTPEHSYDPIIELIAKNTIKHHDITLHVAGSMQDHHVMVQATPHLSDEQIVALLLFGSPQESLSVLMPALITHNLEGLLLGKHKTSIINAYVKKIFKPMSLHFIPRFTDQTGRGGIRGALDIDINDRLRVLLQKNFSLSEDTRFEIEYQLSDDIALRAIRDERRDIAGEIEMRWKF